MLKGIWANLINIIYPVQCLTCRQTTPEEDVICQACLDSIEKGVPSFFLHNKELRFYFDQAFSVCHYQNTAANLIHLLKYKNKTKIAKILADIMSKFIKESHLPVNKSDLIVSIPLHPIKLRERGFNQSELISENIALTFNIEHSNKNLIRMHDKGTQTSLKSHARFLNIQGAFKIKNENEFKGKNILLIDDVLTTGATCSEASRTLKESGARSISVLTFAG